MPSDSPGATQSLLRAVVSSLVDRPEEVEIRALDARSFEILVNAEDLPRVLGRNGQTVRALRAVASLMPPERRSELRISVQPR